MKTIPSPRKHRKAQGLSLNIIIIGIICLVVLAILIAIFNGAINGFVNDISDSKTSVACPVGQQKSHCDDGEIEYIATGLESGNVCCKPPPAEQNT